MPLVGFLMDTTLAAAHLVFAGVPRALPADHAGRSATWAAPSRIWPSGSTAATRRLPIAGRNIDQPPSAYLKQFYYDTVNFDPDAVELAIAFAGADHILAGSDYPHQIGSIPKMLQVLTRLDVSEADRRKMMGENAVRILGL